MSLLQAPNGAFASEYGGRSTSLLAYKKTTMNRGC